MRSVMIHVCGKQGPERKCSVSSLAAATSFTSALCQTGLRAPVDAQAAQSLARVVRHVTSLAPIDDDGDARQRDGARGDVGGENHVTALTARRLEAFALVLQGNLRQSPIKAA